jgi:TRAP-type C4-dicarboxylate transport system substrate-binding protein
VKNILTLSLVIVFVISGFAQTKYRIKFATQAPEGSAWIKVMNEYSDEVEQLTNGEIKFKIYPGGIQGDENAVVRKMRLGQIHCAGFTGVGAGEILPEFRVLETPFLLRNYEESDFISEMMSENLSKKFEENGYILLGLTEVGFVYVYAKKPIRSMSDLRGVKMWMWEADPLAEAAFQALHANAIPLSITDVLTSLQTNLIDAIYTSPLACVSLQWYTRVDYMMNFPLTNALGAILITKKEFDKLPVDYQKILVEKGHQHMAHLVQLSREANEESIELMKKNGMQLIEIPQANIKEFEKAGIKARESLVGKLYSKELLDKIETAVQEFRSGKANLQTPINQ